jgi:hypothetical protein
MTRIVKLSKYVGSLVAYVVTATPVAAESVEGAQAQAPEQIKTPTTQGNVKLTAIRV